LGDIENTLNVSSELTLASPTSGQSAEEKRKNSLSSLLREQVYAVWYMFEDFCCKTYL